MKCDLKFTKPDLQRTHIFQLVIAATGSRKTSVSSMSSASSGDSSGQTERERLSAREAQEVRWGRVCRAGRSVGGSRWEIMTIKHCI